MINKVICALKTVR